MHNGILRFTSGVLPAVFIYRPQTKFAKVMFLDVSVCPRGGGVSQHALQVVSQYAMQVSRG